MKALTVKQPHASLVALRLKKNETRSWYTSYRGPLAIHASARMNNFEKKLCSSSPFRGALLGAGIRDFSDIPTGAVIATCNLVDCLEITEIGLCKQIAVDNAIIDQYMETLVKVAPLPDEPERSFGDYSEGRFAWILEDVKPIEPVPAKGHLGLWNLPPEVEELIKP